MSRMIHSMIRVRDEAASRAFYADAFGLSLRDRYEMDGFVLLYLGEEEGPFELELTVNADRAEPYDVGDGYGHLALSVDGLDETRRRLAAAGMEPTEAKTLTSPAGQRIGRFFFVTDPDGYQIEVLERGGRFL